MSTDSQQILAHFDALPPAEQVIVAAAIAQRAQAAQNKPPAGPRPGESAYDVAKRLGLIGMSDDGPPDLSTNPKYMEGFGDDGLDHGVD